MGLAAARCSTLAILIALPAHAGDPFPDQRGVLTPDELREANAAMQSARGAEPKLPLVASGRRAGGVLAYAVFSAPPEGEPGASMRRRLFCHAAKGPPRPGEWTCDRETLHEIRLQGMMPQLFAYQAADGAEDPRLPGRIAAYFARCFGDQYQELTGQPHAARVPAVSRVMTERGSVHVSVGEGDTFDEHYTLAANEPGPGRACDFQLLAGRTRTTEFNAGSRAQYEDRRFRESMDKLTDLCIWVNLLSAPFALLLPFAWLLARGRRAVVGISAILSVVGFFSGVGVLVFLKLAHIPDTGNSLLVVFPATGLTLLICGIWIAVGLTAPNPEKA